MMAALRSAAELKREFDNAEPERPPPPAAIVKA